MNLKRLIQTLCLTLHGVYNIKGDSYRVSEGAVQTQVTVHIVTKQHPVHP